ncbi:MazG nucleotide pyrophosphohydrolase domain-containing protein [Streptomyces sp. NPDC005395]|uniref:MazG nucleotide pyrophosphohydrolase domain-containing protein n=1 Tax=Streptomyces sp. NPDC005395 TaxID=3157042 RepID=UPI0033A3E9A6
MRALDDALPYLVELATGVLEAAAARLARSLELKVQSDHALWQLGNRQPRDRSPCRSPERAGQARHGQRRDWRSLVYSPAMDLDELRRSAMRIHDLYDELNRQERGRVWTREEFMLGFMGDAGDLAKLVLAQEGARTSRPDGRAALEHELADCLWSVLILAHRYGIDLESAFVRTMEELEEAISARLDR